MLPTYTYRRRNKKLIEDFYKLYRVYYRGKYTDHRVYLYRSSKCRHRKFSKTLGSTKSYTHPVSIYTSVSYNKDDRYIRGHVSLSPFLEATIESILHCTVRRCLYNTYTMRPCRAAWLCIDLRLCVAFMILEALVYIRAREERQCDSLAIYIYI